MILRPPGYFDSFKPWRRVLGPVSQAFRAGGGPTPSFSCSIVQGPGYSLADPTTATSPQSDQHVVFTVTFGARPEVKPQTFSAPGTYTISTPDPTSWLITNGTLISITSVSTTVWTVTIKATAVGVVSLEIPAGANKALAFSIYGFNADSGVVSVTFTPDTATELRTAYWIYVTGVHEGEIVTTAPYTDYSGNYVGLYVEPRVNPDLSTFSSVAAVDFTGTNMVWTNGSSQLSDAAVVLPGLYPTGWGFFIQATFPAEPTPYNAYCVLRSGAAGNPLQTTFGGAYDAITSATLTVI